MIGVRLGVGCPCPPVRNDIVTPRHLLSSTLLTQWVVRGHIDGATTVTLHFMLSRALKLDVASCYHGNMKTNISGREAAPRFAVYRC